ncbi:peptide chain release factor N(5)-glutamine methyltransferase [Luteimonas sp. SX5]|uniref:Release factor glutamine methyltransferase n=1 Tax=Luteimonas galliterrae TaxID=2940486 RepID=A0ABT0MIJ6_9GAMM|nr:peptide chain release factor N(5)-glutamine methyltransferase [Luteimonas galliterrae]MCL1634438.1 peptide chain release factor N(5)-glutamine methyltransferase [Luteimonas galliterrae]
MAGTAPTLEHALRAARGRIAAEDAELLLLHALQRRDRAWLFAHAADPVPADAASRFESLIARREQGEPVAYLLGRRGFWTLDLETTPAVLIPRPETELLVEQAAVRIPADRSVRVADLGTGSGAIALAIASERPQASVVATDASEAALAVARANARAHGIRNVEFRHGDWLSPLAGERFDLIASNPPYIAAGDPHLRQGDLRFEPESALASGSDGLDAIRTIVRAAPAHLLPGGWLLLEHGWEQGEAVRGLLRLAGFVDVATERDLESRDRVTLGRWS